MPAEGDFSGFPLSRIPHRYLSECGGTFADAAPPPTVFATQSVETEDH